MKVIVRIACNEKEDTIHALITCELNTDFLTHVKNVIKQAFEEETDITDRYFIKTETHRFDLVITIALWCIYKAILDRNKTGKDRRKFALKGMFAREIEKRLEIDDFRKTQNDELPKKLRYCI